MEEKKTKFFLKAQSSYICNFSLIPAICSGVSFNIL